MQAAAGLNQPVLVLSCSDDMTAAHDLTARDVK
jgi:hypothetical protein